MYEWRVLKSGRQRFHFQRRLSVTWRGAEIFRDWRSRTIQLRASPLDPALFKGLEYTATTLPSHPCQSDAKITHVMFGSDNTGRRRLPVDGLGLNGIVSGSECEFKSAPFVIIPAGCCNSWSRRETIF